MLLQTRTVEKPWGRKDLPAPFTVPDGQRIGEIWFEPPPALDALLAKYIFTSEKLSVQVHPSDAQTEAAGLGRQGKEECWLVLDAQPGARLGIGFAEPLDGDTLRAAALDGSIEERLAWHEVQAGDFFYIPANTVHAIGGGISLIEVQQNSDITYRLYDYGRPRELHLDKAVSVAQAGPYPAQYRGRAGGRGEQVLVDGPYFQLIRLDGPPSGQALDTFDRAALLMPIDGGVMAGAERVEAGSCALIERLEGTDIPVGVHALLAMPL